MSVEATLFDSPNAQSEDQISANHANKETLLEASVWKGEHGAFREHMKSMSGELHRAGNERETDIIRCRTNNDNTTTEWCKMESR